MDPRRTRKSQHLVTSAHVYGKQKNSLGFIFPDPDPDENNDKKTMFQTYWSEKKYVQIPSTSHHEISKAMAIGP